jgi:hypothetical protein
VVSPHRLGPSPGQRPGCLNHHPGVPGPQTPGPGRSPPRRAHPTRDREKNALSYQAVQWALDEAPMLRMPKTGLPDTTARAVLVARAERADENGRNSHAAITDIIWRTGFDARTIQRAETRLEEAGLLVSDGTTRWGTPRWNLDMSQRRDPAERAELEAGIDQKRAAEAARVRQYRDKQKAQRTDAESVRTDPAYVRTDTRSVRTDPDGVRTDAAPPEPPTNRPGTPQEPSRKPPPGGSPTPRPPRLPPATPSGLSSDRSLSEPLTPAQDQEGESLPHASAREDGPDLRLVPGAGEPSGATQRGIFPAAVPGPRRTAAEMAIAAAAARRAAARAAHQAREGTA